MNTKILFVLFLQSIFALLVQGTIYIIHPLPGTVCSAGKPCTVEWLDDGVAPLLSDIGPSHVALYNGNQKLIQQIVPVDVSTQHALTFTPDADAGPNSKFYYINFTSVQIIGSKTYSEFSPMFTLDSMTGSFNNPISSDTSLIPVPSSLLAPMSDPNTTTTDNTTSTTNIAPTLSTTAKTNNSTTDPTSLPSSDRNNGTSTSSPVLPTSSTNTPASNNPTSVPSETPSLNSGSPTSINDPLTTNSKTSSTPSGFATSRTTTTRITLTVPASAPTTPSTNPVETPPTADPSAASANGSANQPSAGIRAASVPLLFSFVVAFAFVLLI